MLRLVSFPDDFRIVGSRAHVHGQLGAVPMELGKAVIRSLVIQLGHMERRRREPAAASA
jgi:DNA (cytosine-5)-methyltransferase 1